MGDWYWIGLAVGIGTGCGTALAGLLGSSRAGLLAAAVLGAAAGAGAGFGLDNWDEAIGGAAGGLVAVAGTARVVQGALRRGGTRGGTALLVGLAGLVLAALAMIPAVGYLEAVALPLVAARLRRRAGERFAGLRVLARE